MNQPPAPSFHGRPHAEGATIIVGDALCFRLKEGRWPTPQDGSKWAAADRYLHGFGSSLEALTTV